MSEGPGQGTWAFVVVEAFHRLQVIVTTVVWYGGLVAIARLLVALGVLTKDLSRPVRS